MDLYRAGGTRRAIAAAAARNGISNKFEITRHRSAASVCVCIRHDGFHGGLLRYSSRAALTRETRDVMAKLRVKFITPVMTGNESNASTASLFLATRVYRSCDCNGESSRSIFRMHETFAQHSYIRFVRWIGLDRQLSARNFGIVANDLRCRNAPKRHAQFRENRWTYGCTASATLAR